jgi:hypothetical protein
MAISAPVSSAALAGVYDEIESILKRYSPPLAIREGTKKGKRDFHLVTTKEVRIAGRMKDSLQFASLIEQQHFIGFYFMPIYLNPELHERLSPALLRALKGKYCFHLKSITPELRKGMEEALEIGLQYYRKNGWL